MKIALISDSRIGGGRANSITAVNQAQGFADCGHDVTLFIPDRDDNKDFKNELHTIIEELYGFKPTFEIRIIPVLNNHWIKKISFAPWVAV